MAGMLLSTPHDQTVCTAEDYKTQIYKLNPQQIMILSFY